jgi:hypothetical protein
MMNQQEEQGTASKREYSRFKDTRRFADGVRLHEWVGMVLRCGWYDLRERHPASKMSQSEFSRAAIPILKHLDLIVLIDPRAPLPNWIVGRRDKRLAARGGKLPIWFPTECLYRVKNLWRDVMSDLRDGEIIWSISELRMKKAKSRIVH